MNNEISSVLPCPSVDQCSECEGRKQGFQIFTIPYNQNLMAWDVELAWALCADGRNAIRLHSTYVDEMLRVNRYNPVHLDHVDPAKPGIACVLDYTDDSAPVLCLIDGTHRAARSVRDNAPFFVYLLTPEESARCQHTAKVALFRAFVEWRNSLAQVDTSVSDRC